MGVPRDAWVPASTLGSQGPRWCRGEAGQGAMGGARLDRSGQVGRSGAWLADLD